jgi:Protein of unknown function (DUF3515)
MTESATAARIATLVALPIALIAGLATFWWMGNLGSPEPAPLKPQSTTAVVMSAPPLDDKRAAACRDVVARLPGALRDRPRRPVTAGAGQNAAYGDPAITMTCGVTPVSIPAGGDVYVLSGVCWYSDPAGDGTVWTTVDRDTPVRVSVPGAYHSPGQWVIEFSAPVAAVLPRTANAPAGCSIPG